jgi:phosphatidylglycerophosphatase GEP4
MNISGTLNIFRLITNPSLCLPHYTISNFSQLPVPLSQAFTSKDGKQTDIRAVILDKDNCFAVPHENEVYHLYQASCISKLAQVQNKSNKNQDKFDELKSAYPGSRLLIVSNTAGTSSDVELKQASLLERNTGVKVLSHSTKVRGCDFHACLGAHMRS